VTFRTVYGVDFSGAKEAGRTIWVARTEPVGAGARHRRILRLVELQSMERLCGARDREAALVHLVERIGSSDRALWGMDFPFGLPIEVLDDGARWPDQLRLLRDWQDGAYALGLWCLDRAKRRGGEWHIRRTTDSEARAPFDGYHYRIIYQTFFGMRDVLGPLSRRRGTAVLPFHYARLGGARRVVLESCPGSTLKRWGAPHQNYKQPAGGPLTRVRRRTRHVILAALERQVEIPPQHRRAIMRNPGGDALDAVIAAAGAWQAWHASDHAAIARHPRYGREGYLYV
jgi:hypothetical protein